MNNIRILIIIILCSCLSSSCAQSETEYTTSAKIYLINETDVVIKSDTILGYVMQPGDTLIHIESHSNEYGEKPSIDSYDPFATSNEVFVYGNNSQCELGLFRIENYENRKETSPLNFEFTFRFTKEKQNKAKPCNL